MKELINAVFIMPCLSMLLYFYKVKKLISLAIFYGTAYCLLFLILSGLYSIDNVLVNSHNYVSHFIILNSIPYYVTCVDNRELPSILPPLVCLFIALIAIGRGGILMAGIVLLGVLFLKWNEKGVKGVMYKTIMLLILLFIAYVGISPDFTEEYFGRFLDKGLATEGRADGFSEYLYSLCNIKNMLLGTRIESLPYVYRYLDGSLHNSFLTLHARYGIVSIMIMYCMYKGIGYIYCKKEYPIFFVLIAMLVKGMSDADTGGNFTGGDIYVYYLLLNYISYKNSKKIDINESKSVGTLSASVSSNS